MVTFFSTLIAETAKSFLEGLKKRAKEMQRIIEEKRNGHTQQ
jgi:hypothetical protein